MICIISIIIISTVISKLRIITIIRIFKMSMPIIGKTIIGKTLIGGIINIISIRIGILSRLILVLLFKLL